MKNNPCVIFSDSEALIGDIEYVFRDQLACVSSESLSWVKNYLHSHNVKLLIADMDMKLAVRTEILNELRELGDQETALLFLISESKKLELERNFGDLGDLNTSADYLIKPFSRNSLISSVGHLTT